MNIKTFLFITVGSALLVGSLVVLPGCSESFQQEYEAGFRREFERAFVKSCSSGDLPQTACQCLATELLEKHSTTELTKWGLTGYPDEAMDAAAFACDLEPK